MIYYSLDFETTGVNITDRPIEFGGILYSTNFHRIIDSQGFLLRTTVPITPEITRITGITQPMLDKFGYDDAEMIHQVIETMGQADAVVGYNSRRFDKFVLEQWAKREGYTLPDKPWIDFFMDMPWQVPTGKLSHVLADHGILNYFPHSALADAEGVVLLSQKYDPDLMLARSQSPAVVLRSLADRSQNDLVKAAKFRWNPGAKIWWKPVKEQDVKEITQVLPFSVTIDDRSPEELDN